MSLPSPVASPESSTMILRAATSADVEALLDIQQPAAVQGLGHLFPQDDHPFPRRTIASRWLTEIDDPDVSVYLYTEDDGSIRGFAAVRGHELLHFGTALPTWGTGLASRFHDTLLEATTEVLRQGKITLRVFEENRRARRFYEKKGWRPTGRTSRTNLSPHPVLLEYERQLTQLP
jgi:RimJ/RimL family protein N-acetyltransferase